MKMSSFGSCGSDVGASLESAAGMLSSPKPVSMSNCWSQMSVALNRIRSNICVWSRLDRVDQTHAVAAATIGAEKLVPLTFSQPALEKLNGIAATMSSPGAARSTASLAFEKYEGRL